MMGVAFELDDVDEEDCCWTLLGEEFELEPRASGSDASEDGGGRGWLPMLDPLPSGIGAKFGSLPLAAALAVISRLSRLIPRLLTKLGGRLALLENDAARSTPGNRSASVFFDELACLDGSGGGKGSSLADGGGSGAFATLFPPTTEPEGAEKTPSGVPPAAATAADRKPSEPDPEELAEEGRFGEIVPLSAAPIPGGGVADEAWPGKYPFRPALLSNSETAMLVPPDDKPEGVLSILLCLANPNLERCRLLPSSPGPPSPGGGPPNPGGRDSPMLDISVLEDARERPGGPSVNVLEEDSSSSKVGPSVLEPIENGLKCPW